MPLVEFWLNWIVIRKEGRTDGRRKATKVPYSPGWHFDTRCDGQGAFFIGAFFGHTNGQISATKANEPCRAPPVPVTSGFWWDQLTMSNTNTTGNSNATSTWQGVRSDPQKDEDNWVYFAWFDTSWIPGPVSLAGSVADLAALFQGMGSYGKGFIFEWLGPLLSSSLFFLFSSRFPSSLSLSRSLLLGVLGTLLLCPWYLSHLSDSRRFEVLSLRTRLLQQREKKGEAKIEVK